MAAIDTIIARLDELRVAGAFEDLGPTWLQGPASRDVRRVLTGVAAQREPVVRAVAVAEGTPVSVLLESGYPRLHFSRKGAVEIALRNFSAQKLVAIIDQLATAAFDMRKQATLAAAIAQRTLLAIAANAKRRG